LVRWRRLESFGYGFDESHRLCSELQYAIHVDLWRFSGWQWDRLSATGYQTAGGPPVSLVGDGSGRLRIRELDVDPGTVANPTSSSTTIKMSAPENVTANFMTRSPGVYSPASGSILASSSATFEWGPYPSATAYWLEVGSTSGGNNYWQSGTLSATTFSQTVSSLPENGSTVWVDLVVLGRRQLAIHGIVWFNGRINCHAHQSDAKRVNSSGEQRTFTWQAGADTVSAYWIDEGSTAGGNNYYQSESLPTTTTSVTVNNLPIDGSEVYVTLYSLVSGTWLNNPYYFYAFSANSCVSTITSPTPGSTLTAYSDTFSWTVSSNPGCSGVVTGYWLDAGTTASENAYYQSGNIGDVTTWTTSNSLPPGYGGAAATERGGRNDSLEFDRWNVGGEP